MSDLVVRAYNVGFGDAMFVTVPDRDAQTGKETVHSILIDVGNIAVGTGSGHKVFERVVKDVLARLGDRNVDLYVMTHEHYDHVTGLYDAFHRYGLRVGIDYAWLTASSAPGYHSRHAAARQRRDLINMQYAAIGRHLSATSAPGLSAFQGLLANNDPVRTRKRVEFLQTHGRATKGTRYVYAGRQLHRGADHPFKEARLSILAPEKDTTCYPVGLQPLPLTPPLSPKEPVGDAHGHTVPLSPPSGVDPRAFARLLELRKRGIATNILAIDRAANSTSVVLLLEWRGWRLLFTGDAEEASWAMMEELERGLVPVHFLKVGHHGSINGTPDDSILEAVLPLKRPDSRKRTVLVSTCPGTVYGEVPHEATLNRLRERCDKLRSTTEVPRGEAIEISFNGRPSQ
jgi:beta-lactamase superfamily II metal-dependent hydrolase